MIRTALRIVIAAITSAVVVVGTLLCLLSWKDDRRLALAAVVLLVGCASVGPMPSRPMASTEDATTVRWSNPEPMAPTTMHSFIYTMMQECLGTERGNFWAILWHQADFLVSENWERLEAAWVIREGSPWIILDRRFAHFPPTVSEEILHDLLRGGEADHEDPRFIECVIRPLQPRAPR